MKIAKLNLFLTTVVIFQTLVEGSALHPRLLCSDEDRPAILAKIATLDWARKSYEGIKNAVDPWANRHLTDPEFLLSRLPMHWVEGRRFTHTYYDATTTQVTNFGGNAPYPTLRQGDQRIGTNENGIYYIAPDLERLPSYCTNGLWLMSTTAGGEKEWANPGVLFLSKMGNFLQLAAQSAFLYWLTGQEKYGRLAADVLMVVSKGIPPLTKSGPSPTTAGFVGWQGLDDSNVTESLPFLFDFIYDYLTLNNGRISTTLRPPDSAKITYVIGTNAEIYLTLERFMSNYARVLTDMENNHNAVRSSGLVNCTLAHDSTALRASYFSNFTALNNGHIHPLWWMVSNNFNNNMTWMEPGSYGNYPLGALLPACYQAERAGFPAFTLFPNLLTAPISFDRATFPNGLFPQYGDDGSATFSPPLVELMLAQAVKMKNAEATQRLARVLQSLIQGGYTRVVSSTVVGIRHLASSLSFLPSAENAIFGVTGEIDFATYTSQRNGEDPRFGLMFGLYGGGGTNFGYSHNSAKGLSLSLYGRGSILGLDAGAYSPYEAPIYLHYYSRPAGCNTVIVNGNSQPIDRSRSMVLWSGSRVNPIFRNAVEPAAQANPVCALASFLDVSWMDGTNGVSPAQSASSLVTNTPHVAIQRRVNAIVRTSPISGYYLDIYRSKWLSGDATIPGNLDLSEKYHDYLYHNAGWDGANSVWFRTPAGKKVATSPTSVPQTNDVTPGFFSPGQEYFTQKEGLDSTNTMVAEFDFAPVGMSAWSLGQEGRTYVKMSTPVSQLQPASMKAVQNNNTGVMPAMLIRQTGEAWMRPFVVLYEPYDNGNSTINQVRRFAGVAPSNDFVGIAVESKPLTTELNGRVERIFNATNFATNYVMSNEGFSFQGTYAVWAENATGFLYAYLGNGSQVRKIGSHSLQMANGSNGSACLIKNEGKFAYTAGDTVTVTLRTGNPSDQAFNNLTLYAIVNRTLVEGASRATTPDSTGSAGLVSANLPAGTSVPIYIGPAGRGGTAVDGSITLSVNGATTSESKLTCWPRDAIGIQVSDSFGVRPESLVLVRGSVKIPSSIWTTQADSSRSFRLAFTASSLINGSYALIATNDLGVEIRRTFDFYLNTGGDQTLQIRPNPFSLTRGTVDLLLDLDGSETDLRLQIVTLGGHLVEERARLPVTAGRNRFSWSGRTGEGRTVWPGVYLARFSCTRNGQSVQILGKIVVER